MMRSRSVLVCVLTLLCGSTSALAQTVEPVPVSPELRRRALLDQAIRASDAGYHIEAIELFRQAGEIEMRPGLRVSMAEEYQTLGQTQLACESATRGEIDSQADLGRHDSALVLERGTLLITQTCGHFGRVRLHLPSPLPAGIGLTVANRTLESIQSEDIAIALPGAVTVTATIPNEAPFRQEVTLREGETRDVTVTFRHTDVRVVTAPNNALRYVAYGLLGIGGVALVVGFVELGVTASQQRSMANANPAGTDTYAAWARYDNGINPNRTLTWSTVCARAANDTVDPSAVGAREVCSANATARAVTIGGLVTGGVLLAGGVTMLLLNRPGSSALPSGGGRADVFRLTPVVAAGYRGVSATWVF